MDQEAVNAGIKYLGKLIRATFLLAQILCFTFWKVLYQ
jgi:hypothetical protein